jgi:signal transduction histidine kinase
LSQKVRLGILLAVLAAASGTIAWMRLRAPRLDDRIYRIGWMLSPPFQVRGPDGHAAGISVDVVSEAARRRGIKLRWVFWPDSSESALVGKYVDLWPLITITPERLKVLHISEPYLEHGRCFLVRDDSGYTKPEDLATAHIGVANVSIDAVHLRSILPDAITDAHNDIESVLDDVCRQRTAAAFMDKYTAIAALLEQKGCAGHNLRWIGVPHIRSRLGVGSTFEARAAADAIREEIGAMSAEGKVAELFGRWGFMTGQDLESVETLLDARRRETRLLAVAALFALLFALSCWLALWLIRERNRTRRTEEALRESQDRYLQAQKLESIGRLAGGVAHDFNNLLTVINGYSELVYRKLAAPDPLRIHIDEIRKAGARAAELTQQLLAFGRKQVARPRPLNLSSVVHESQSMFRRLLGEDIEFVTKLDPAIGLVMMDPVQIHQVLMNLVVNARDAMPAGGRLLIQTWEEKVGPELAPDQGEVKAGPAVVLSVTDSGAGMNEETRKHLFEPFFTTKGPAKGTGLGLATVYGIVKQSNGWIWVDSEPGKGACFKICLPRIADAASASNAVR